MAGAEWNLKTVSISKNLNRAAGKCHRKLFPDHNIRVPCGIRTVIDAIMIGIDKKLSGIVLTIIIRINIGLSQITSGWKGVYSHIIDAISIIINKTLLSAGHGNHSSNTVKRIPGSG